MNRESFVDAARLAVQDAAVSGTISELTRPPGRKPDENLVALSVWFNQLAVDDRQNVERVVETATRTTLFDFLCVLDGGRAIESGQVKGTLDLRYRRGKVDISLNDDDGEMLHELL
jgi:hypothetical protein